MTIRWKRALTQGVAAASLLLALYWIPTWRFQPEVAFVFRATEVLCKSCNPIPDSAVVALLDQGRSQWHTCLRIEEADPSPALLARLHSLDRKIVSFSQCTRSDETGFSTPGGKQAMAVSLHEWRRVSLTKATVSTSESPGFILGGSGWTCDLRRSGDLWSVGDCRMEWIS